MANPFVVDLNLMSTIARQNHKCLECGKKFNMNNPNEQVYFRMDQKARPEIYEVYCRECGLIKQEEDKRRGIKIDKELHRD